MVDSERKRKSKTTMRKRIKSKRKSKI